MLLRQPLGVIADLVAKRLGLLRKVEEPDPATTQVYSAVPFA